MIPDAPWLRTSLFLLVGLACCSARADAFARLEVERAPEVLACPDAALLRDGVSAQLGRDPFRDDATHVLRVRFARERAGLRATVQSLLDDGAAGERVLRSRERDCVELAEAVALTLGILLDALPIREPEPEPEPEAAHAHAHVLMDAHERRPEEPTRMWGVRLEAGATAVLGNGPRATWGALVSASIESERFFVSLGLRVDGRATNSMQGREVATSYVAAALAPCLKFGPLYACGVLTVGAIEGSVEGASPTQQRSVHALVGPRLGYELALTPWLSFALHAEGAYAVTRTRLHVGSNELWQSGPFSGLLALGVVGRMP